MKLNKDDVLALLVGAVFMLAVGILNVGLLLVGVGAKIITVLIVAAFNITWFLLALIVNVVCWTSLTIYDLVRYYRGQRPEQGRANISEGALAEAVEPDQR